MVLRGLEASDTPLHKENAYACTAKDKNARGERMVPVAISHSHTQRLAHKRWCKTSMDDFAQRYPATMIELCQDVNSTVYFPLLLLHTPFVRLALIEPHRTEERTEKRS